MLGGHDALLSTGGGASGQERRETFGAAALDNGLEVDEGGDVIEHSIVIERPLFDVFDYLMDVGRLWEWAPFCLDSRVTDTDDAGWPTRYWLRAGFTQEVSYETEVAITDVRRGRSVSFRQAEPAQVAIYTLQSAPGGTIVTASHNPWVTLMLAPLQGAFDVLSREVVNDALVNLKRVLEARPPSSRPAVFLSYRRDAAEYVAGRIGESIAREFGDGALFRDIDAIRAGEYADDAIDKGLEDCTAMIVLIDVNWLEAFDARAECKDYVVMEIEAGLRLGRPIIPVTLAGVDDKRVRRHLPPEIDALKDMQWQTLRHDPDFAPDMNRIVERVWKTVMISSPGMGDTDEAPRGPAPRRPGPPAWDATVSGALGTYADFVRRALTNFER